MGRFLLVGLLLFAVSQALAGPPVIDGPSRTEVNTKVEFLVKDLVQPPDDASRAQLREWRKKIMLVVDSPTGGDAIVTVFNADDGQEMRLLLGITPRSGGVYFVVAVDGGSADGKAIGVKRLVVGPEVPPVPPPSPSPAPPPPDRLEGKRLLLLIRETSDVTPQQNLTEIAMRQGFAADYLKRKGHLLLIQSDDQPLPVNIPPAAKTAFEKAKNMPQPVLAIINPAADASSGVLTVESIPADIKPEVLLELIKKHGG